jgi:hypothetical protein
MSEAPIQTSAYAALRRLGQDLDWSVTGGTDVCDADIDATLSQMRAHHSDVVHALGSSLAATSRHRSWGGITAAG